MGINIYQFLRKYKALPLFILAAVMPLLLSNNYHLHVLNLAGIYAILTLSLNMLTGFTGLLCVGQIAFYGIGAYTSAIFSVTLGMPVFFSMLMGGVVASLFGLLVGLPTLRLRGLYLAVATMAFGEIMYQLFVNLEPITNGTKGILNVPAPALFGFKFNTYGSYYYLVLLTLAFLVTITHNIIRSRVGRAMLSIRENEVAAAASGINPTRYKVMVFMCSAFFAGIAGSLYVHEVRFVSPESFVTAESSSVLAMMVVGGIGSIPGAIVGGMALTIIPELFRSFGDIRLVVYGATIVMIIIFAPKGLGGLFEWAGDHINKRAAAAINQSPRRDRKL